MGGVVFVHAGLARREITQKRFLLGAPFDLVLMLIAGLLLSVRAEDHEVRTEQEDITFANDSERFICIPK
jgi:hypothetical protein